MLFMVSESGAKSWLRAARRARFEIAVAEVAGGLAQGFQIAPDRAHPEPQGDAENDADQAPGQQAQAQFERQALL